MPQKYKYPRTYHLPFSLGYTSDDKVLKSDSHLVGKKVMVSLKMDGEAVTAYKTGEFHARSLDSKHSDYHSWMASFIKSFSYLIPEGIRVCGEYLYAKHSIEYTELSTYFMIYSLWRDEQCLSWDETELIINQINKQLIEFGYPEINLLKTVPVLYIGIYDTEKIKQIAKQTVANGGEGIVVRIVDSFSYVDFPKSLAKYVRPNHVQTDKHWKNQQIVPNKLK